MQDMKITKKSEPPVRTSTGQKNILCLFDYACNTGFATVSQNIVPRLKRAFGKNLALDILAINYLGPGYDEDERTRVFSAKHADPTLDKDGNPTPDVFGRIGFMQELVNTSYDGIFIIQDLNAVTADKAGHGMTILLEQIQKGKKTNNTPGFKSMFYFPVDCGLINQQVIGLEFFDMLVTYTEFARNVVLGHRPELKTRLKVIPHGNNNKDYYPFDEYKDDSINFRRTFFGEINPGERFIIINVNRNQPRKDIPNTVFGFIEAKANWPADLPKPFLYLHMHPVDKEGWDLEIFLQQTGLKEGEDYMLMPKDMYAMGASVDVMNRIYNAADLFLTTTTGEGWGLTVTEAMATRTAVICTNYSSLPEMTGFGKRAWLLENLYPHCSVVGSMIRYQTDLYEVGEKIIEVAIEKRDNTPQYRDKIEQAYQYALSLDWDMVADKWVEYFHQVFKVPYRKQ